MARWGGIGVGVRSEIQQDDKIEVRRDTYIIICKERWRLREEKAGEEEVAGERREGKHRRDTER